MSLNGAKQESPAARTSGRPIRRELRSPPPGLSRAKELEGPWLGAGLGLRLYARALEMRLIGLVFLGIVAAVFYPLFSVVAPLWFVFLGATVLLTGVSAAAMFIGVNRFVVHQPAESPSIGIGSLARGALGVGLCVEFLSVLWLVTQGLGGVGGSKLIALVLGTAGFIHVVAMIITARRLSRLFEPSRVPRGPVVSLGFAAVAIATTGLFVRGSSFSGSNMLLMVCGVSLAVLVAVALYIAMAEHLSALLCRLGHGHQNEKDAVVGGVQGQRVIPTAVALRRTASRR